MTLLRHVTAAVEVGALAVTTVSSVAHYRASVVHAPDFASAVHPVIDSHPVSLDRPHLAILTESRAAAVLHGNSLASCGLMAGVCSGISGFVPGCLTSLVATRLPGFVPAHLTSLVATRLPGFVPAHRTEERRVGQECRSRWSPY